MAEFSDRHLERPTLFIGGLHSSLNEDFLMSYFSEFGEVIKCEIPRSKGNKPTEYGFVTFEDIYVASKVLNVDHYINDHSITVSVAKFAGYVTAQENDHYKACLNAAADKILKKMEEIEKINASLLEKLATYFVKVEGFHDVIEYVSNHKHAGSFGKLICSISLFWIILISIQHISAQQFQEVKTYLRIINYAAMILVGLILLACIILACVTSFYECKNKGDLIKKINTFVNMDICGILTLYIFLVFLNAYCVFKMLHINGTSI